ncbi:methionine--tRNA ligase, cytoplasmic [Coccinella septempunctata]|uniref:methionine--tRNA ligase, cytoplasmic n=1 Tax=Coccinella septempunctata TaxID=41139 RepID=UPI001D09416B|nr:methionine--tRNA ligase, cytoplasmic [Coccinella septempunctata]
MVAISSNENNPATLKLIVAAKYSKQEVEIVKVNLNDKNVAPPKHLPYFEVDDEIIFTSNAGLLYLLPPEQNESKVYEWLEWEAAVFTPVIAFLIGNSSKNSSQRSKFVSCLKKLNVGLENQQFLTGDSLTACDISIWSVLFPLVKDDTLCKEYIDKSTQLFKWFENLEKHSAVVEALKLYKVAAGQISYQVLLASCKYLNEFGIENANVGSPDQVAVEVTLEEIEAAKESWNRVITNDIKKFDKPVLPKPDEKNILITSALPYVNNVPHLGNIIGCVLSADVFARYSRLLNRNVLFVCGTDEYGTATETKALEEGLSCKQICDKYFKIHDAIYKWFNISFDHFGRTSTPQQTEISQDIFLQLNDNGFIFIESVEQLHCEKCDRFLADRFVEGGCPHVGCTYENARGDQCDGCGKLVNAIELKNARCKICGNTPKIKSSSQFFMDLPKLEPLLLHWFKQSSPGWSANAQTICKAWLKEGLKPRCITRDLKWGVPVPMEGYRNKVFYVWFDAPIGYMSITKNYTEHWQKWWKPEANTDITLYNFMAKDNVPFHSIMFPATLLGCNRGYVTVKHIMATEYLNYEDGKFSKSRGVGVFGTDAQNTNIPSDVWRFYLLYVRPESQDSNFNWSDLATKNNSELLNNLGNFINRALMFVKNSFKKTIPKIVLNEDDLTLLALCNREFKAYIAALEKAKLKDGIRHILGISKHGNQYMQSNQPWVLLKGTEEEKIRAGTVIGVCSNIVCFLSIMLSPYLPETSEKIRKQLNVDELNLFGRTGIANFLPEGHVIGEPSPLFTKIEESQIEELKKRFGGKQETQNNNTKNIKELDTNDKALIQKMVDEQAAAVRKLKEGGADKSVWQPEVKKLLALKEKLKVATTNEASNGLKDDPKVASNGLKEDPKVVEEEIAKQGLVVRKLKEGGAEKSVWQPEVEKLLALKNKLASITGVPVVQPKGKKGKK